MSDDKQLKQSVLDELKWEPSVNAARIGVTIKDGVVTLTGSVETYAEKHAAETAALRVKGVKAVAEETGSSCLSASSTVMPKSPQLR